MVKNKKVGAGLALPEMQVGTRPPIAAPQSVDTIDSTVAEPDDVDVQDNAS